MHGRERSLLLIAAFILLMIVQGCSSTQLVTTTTPVENGSGIGAQASTADSLLPRQAIVIDSLPPVPDVNLADYPAVMDRARLHVVLARKALEKGDTLRSFEDCQQAARQLDKAACYPDAESDSDYTVLSRTLASLYNVCVVKIPDASFDLPMSVMNAIFDAKIQTDAVDLSRLTFKEPPSTTIPLPLNEDVERNIYFFSTQARGTYERWLERSGRYFPGMRKILKEEGLPDEIIFLTMVESGVNPNARSIAKCVGLWQFLKSTGERYGLYGDAFCDDRRDPEKATRAAGRHLRDLYNRYKDWHLALAAYNAGAGRIDRAILASKLDRPSFWDIKPLLPNETQNYVPRFIAVAVIGLNLDAYEFAHVDYQDPFEYDVLKVKRGLALDDLAQAIGADPALLREMNPHILQGATPGGGRETIVKVPTGLASVATEQVNRLPERSGPDPRSHKVKRGETLSRIAKKYGVSESALRAANDLQRHSRVRNGMVLRIPALGDPRGSGSAVARDNLASPTTELDQPDRMRNTRGRNRVQIRVGEGMTLGGIAERHHVTIADLMTWNGLPSNAVIKTGMDLTIWVRPDRPMETTTKAVAATQASPPQEDLPYVRAKASPAHGETAAMNRHRVQRGETLAGIAAAFNVSLDNLMNWNNLSTPRVHTGKVLKIYTPAKVIAGKPLYDTSKSRGPAKAEVPTRPLGKEYQHRVAKGESLWGIASQYKVTAAEISDWNNLNSDALVTGQALKIYSNEYQPQHRPEPRDKQVPTASAGNTSTMHVVKKGESLYSIARRHGLSKDSLMAWNGLSSANVKTGQELILTSVVRPGKREPVGPDRYVVKKGDKLSRIAKTHGLEMDEIRAWNDIKGTDIYVGQELRLSKPEKAVATVSARKAVVTPDSSTESEPSTYVVEKGETLYGIAKKLGVAIEDLRKWNPSLTTLKAGQSLQYHTVD